MFNAASVIDRLVATVPELGSVEGAAELAALLNAPPQVWAKPRAHVVPMGIRGGKVLFVTGVYVQDIEAAFSVYVSVASHGDAKGKRSMLDVSALQNKIITCLCGWVPDGLTIGGEVRLSRSYLAELKPGLLVYAMDFTLPDQLRISL